MKQKYQKIAFPIIVLGVVFFAVGVFLGSEKEDKNISQNNSAELEEIKTQKDCTTTKKEFEVRGNSMSPEIEPGMTLTLIENYFACNPAEPGDLVAATFAGNDDPLIKKVRAVGGDEVEFDDDELKINGKTLKNSAGDTFYFAEKAQKMISLYLKNGKLKDGTVLLFGDNPGGSLDSRKFGALSVSTLLGKFE